ncbi:carboxymuconolactone decarboxylase family protein [Haliea sp. E17]|uniref:carboxymuconolactone decarboxylase family protein n=1 Tax=Haliea sp. E17 TaxID=3401576 RepID=UPI003AAADC41
MSFISTTAPENAHGPTGALYQRLGAGGYLPNYARLFSHRPELMEHISRLMDALREPLPPRQWKLANFAAARACNSSYCSLAYARRLLDGELEEAQVHALAEGREAALEDAEQALVEFATRVASDPAHIEQADIDRLRACGYSDTQIFDLAAAVSYRCFFSRIADALGAPPDAELANGLDSELVRALCTGRAPAAPAFQQS